MQFRKCQDKSQIIKTTTGPLKLSTNKHFQLFRSHYTGPAMLQDDKIKKSAHKKTRTHAIA